LPQEVCLEKGIETITRGDRDKGARNALRLLFLKSVTTSRRPAALTALTSVNRGKTKQNKTEQNVATSNLLVRNFVRANAGALDGDGNCRIIAGINSMRHKTNRQRTNPSPQSPS
jgi:hypothetical protein